MLKRLDKAIEHKNETELKSCIRNLFNQSIEIQLEIYPQIELLLREKWHNQHEDLVNTISLKNLRSNRFIDPIMNIAKEKETFRPFDDELESTLRKCIHALKTINTPESNDAVRTLVETGNENVKYALENYK